MRRMNMRNWPTWRRSSSLAAIFACGILGAATAAAQGGSGGPPEGGKPPEKQEEKQKPDDVEKLPGLNPFSQPEVAPGEAEMRELFKKVDKRLKRVTELLYEASSGDASRANEIGSARIDELIREAESAATSAENGIARLLEASKRQGSAAGSEIERILEIAAQNPRGGSGGPPPPPSSGESQPQQGQTPSGSRREEKGQEPGPEQQGEQEGEQPQPQPGEQEQGENGETPKDNRRSEAEPDSDKGAGPNESERGAPANPRGAEEWGDLPIHLRSVFQNSVSDDVPPRYRDWIDSYYKRLNRSAPR